MSIEVYFDGRCEPNPDGLATYGVIIRQDNCDLLRAGDRVPDRGIGTTNNIAEYAALIEALNFLIENGLEQQHIVVMGDSKLVIDQMFGSWGIGKGRYAPLARIAKELLGHFTQIEGHWIPRDENAEADALAEVAATGTTVWAEMVEF